MSKNKKPKKLDQKIIDAYENYIWNVNEAIRFVKVGSGRKHLGVFSILEPIIKIHEEELYKKISDEMSKEEVIENE